MLGYECFRDVTYLQRRVAEIEDEPSFEINCPPSRIQIFDKYMQIFENSF